MFDVEIHITSAIRALNLRYHTGKFGDLSGAVGFEDLRSYKSCPNPAIVMKCNEVMW